MLCPKGSASLLANSRLLMPGICRWKYYMTRYSTYATFSLFLENKTLNKMTQKRMECFRLLLDHLAWFDHQFLSDIRDSWKPGSLWEMMRRVGGVRKSIHQSWWAKGLGLLLGLLCWGFKGVQEEIPSEEASTLQIGSVAFPPGQCTSPQLHHLYRLFDQDGESRQFLTLPIV